MRWTLAVVLSFLVLALPAHAADDVASKTMTIRVLSITTQAKVLVDRAPKNVGSGGDVFWAKSVLRNDVAQFGRPKGALVGSDTSTFTLRSRTQVDVKATAKLPGGTIRVAGRIQGDGPQAIRVIGGTGRFAKASGTCVVRNLSASGNRALNVYRLRLP